MFYKTQRKLISKRITFIGLGNMGLPMALNLHKAGMKVSAYDLNKDFIEAFKKEGGHSSNDMNGSIKDSDCLISMLPSYKATESVWNNAFAHAKKNTVFIDNSTFSPIDAKKIGKQAKEKGVIAALVPVSGGVPGAQNGTLSFMVGSEKEDFENVKQYLLPMGKNFYYCGDYAAGQIVKICNNLCLGISMAGLSEALALGVKLGADPKILSDVMSTSTARCWSLDTYNPIPGILPNAPASRDYNKGYNIELIKKDLTIADECAKEVGLDSELGRIVFGYYLDLDKKGQEKKDMGLIYKYILQNKKL